MKRADAGERLLRWQVVIRYLVAALYPHSYPQASRNPPELVGTHRNNRTQPDSTGGLPRFRYAVPLQPQYLVGVSVNRAPDVVVSPDRTCPSSTSPNPATSCRAMRLVCIAICVAMWVIVVILTYGLAVRSSIVVSWGRLEIVIGGDRADPDLRLQSSSFRRGRQRSRATVGGPREPSCPRRQRSAAGPG